MRHAAVVALLLLLPLTAAARPIDFDEVAIEQWVGAGENEALLVIDWRDGRQLAFGYRWALLDVATGLDMLEAINDATDRLHRSWVEDMAFEAVFGLGWDVDGDGFAPDDPDDWYEAGWFEDGFWGYYVATDGADWDFAPVGLADRALAHGDWDGYAWAPEFVSAPPVVPLVPAPPAAGLLLLAAVHYNRRR